MLLILEIDYPAADRLSRTVWTLRVTSGGFGPNSKLYAALDQVTWESRPSTRHKFGQVRREAFRTWTNYPNGHHSRGVELKAWVNADRAFGDDLRGCHEVIMPPSAPGDLIERAQALLRPVLSIPANTVSPRAKSGV